MLKKIKSQFKKVSRALLFLNSPEHYYSRVKYLERKGMKIGKNVQILHDTILDSSRAFLIEIGNNVTFAPRCHLLTHDASMNIFQKKTRIGKVKIKDNCFIGAGTIILPNVTIGPNAIIGAGSVVTKNVPKNSVIAGNPAKFICSLEDFLKKHDHLSVQHPNYPYPEFHGDWISKENASKMEKELDNTFGYSTSSKNDI